MPLVLGKTMFASLGGWTDDSDKAFCKIIKALPFISLKDYRIRRNPSTGKEAMTISNAEIIIRDDVSISS